jgi:hypothetical protein
MRNPRWLAGCLLVVFLCLPSLAVAQSPLITLSIEAGFDGRFRDNEWLPIIIAVRNDGDAVEGRLVVRPETSGAGIVNTYSAPVSLPEGADQTVTLYITARSFAQQVRVEMIDQNGAVIGSESANLRAMLPLDRLYVVVTESAVGSVDLTSAAAGGYDAFQTNWRVRDVPDQATALGAVDVMLFSDVDTSALSLEQRAAVADWVTSGGHLIVTGGPAWQATAAAFVDLLPLNPQNSTPIASLNPLAEWLRTGGDLGAQTVIATGVLREAAQTLVEVEGTPLLVRRSYGGGVVDYLAADPNTAPLRGWAGLGELWLTLQTTVGAQPGWNYGFNNWDFAAQSVEILPGFNLLPDVLPLCGFLGLYIALIGPLNYFVLARLNRREFAWITIPIFILVFSGLAWALGFNLRGTEATLSRLSLVQSWHDADRARVDGLIGMLSPRRGQYDLTLIDDGTLRPIPRLSQTNLLSNVQASVEISQTERFRADNFLVDASFIAGFNTGSLIEKPAISGTATLIYDGTIGQISARGSVTNDSDITLYNPVLLGRGFRLALDEPLAPGAVETFEISLTGEGAPTPALYAPNALASGISPYYSSYYYFPSSPTVIDLLGQENTAIYDTSDPVLQEDRRRRTFLASFIADFYANPNYNITVGTGRGDQLYLAGWTDSAPQTVELDGAVWNSDDTTLYLIELETTFAPGSGVVTIAADRFTWVVEDYTGLGEVAPINLTLQPGEIASFRYTPLPTAVLDEVTQLVIRMEQPSIAGTDLPIAFYNWEASDWEEVRIRGGLRRISEPERFLGAENTVRVRVDADLIGGYIRFDRLVIEQRGRF